MIPSTPFWLRLFPSFMRSRLEHRPGLQQALTNTGWLFGDKILRMGVGLLVGVWVARYLGPAQFGLFSYATAFVALFGAVASLGLNGIVVRDLIKEPDQANSTLGTTFVLQLIGGLLAYTMAVFAIGLVRPDDALVKLMVAVLGAVMVIKASEVVKYWFEAQVQSKYVVWVENGAFVLFAGVKISLILVHAPLITFAWIVLAEAVLVALFLFWVYTWRGGRLGDWQGQIKRAGALIKDSWPLLLSGLAIIVYMRIDQIMLGQMIGDEAVGIYSAAVRISEVWYFIPITIVASVFPTIIEAKKNSESRYYEMFQKLYDLMVMLAMLVAMPITFLADWLVLFLYGDAYHQAGAVLAIHVWAGVFVFLGVASGKWFIIENMQRNAFYRNGSGLITNIILNYLFIPSYGTLGAAYSTLLSQAMAAYLYDCLQKKTRISFIIKTKALFQFRFITFVKNYLTV